MAGCYIFYSHNFWNMTLTEEETVNKRRQIEENVSRAKLQQIRIDSFLAKIELRKLDPNCTLAESQALDELKNNADFRPDEELSKLPCFSQYVIDCIEKRELELKVNIKASGIYIAFLTDLDRLQVEMMNISKQSGLYKADSEEFQELIHHWWTLHRVIHSQRVAWLYRFQVPMPPPKALMPDRLYLGVLLNEEDYVFFLAKNMIYSRGMVIQKGENEETYSNELSKKAFGDSTPTRS